MLNSWAPPPSRTTRMAVITTGALVIAAEVMLYLFVPSSALPVVFVAVAAPTFAIGVLFLRFRNEVCRVAPPYRRI